MGWSKNDSYGCQNGISAPKNRFKVENTTKVVFSYINSRITAPLMDEFMLTFMVRRSQKARFNLLTLNWIAYGSPVRALPREWKMKLEMLSPAWPLSWKGIPVDRL